MPEPKVNQCPRCGGGIPNDLQRGKYPGALSRSDNKTYVCSACGQAEALSQFPTLGIPKVTRDQWWDRTGVRP